MLSKHLLREQIIQETKRFKQIHKPVVPVEIPLDTPDRQPIRLKAGFKHNGEPTSVHERLELYAVTWKNGRVMRNGYRGHGNEHIKALDCK